MPKQNVMRRKVQKVVTALGDLCTFHTEDNNDSLKAESNNLMAKALYDNAPESPEELSFRKGDILMVIEQNTGGLEGWWLCSLHGRQGIAPGNRLKLLVGPIYDSCTSEPSSSVATQQSLQQGIYQVPPSLQGPSGCGSSFRDPIYQVPPSQLSQNIYQVPPTASGQGAQGHEIYQVPPSVHRSPWVDNAPPTSKINIQ
ncbi:enhancer of filamentation 1-like [Rhincodon typus]|uniref:enhancer of filamentation 1-like n=1 Tax=Rhincodon typus TaxID=259920 RepID=UPI0020306736|nr:enhancer of filamentation 1-like [Rhincodon typus]